MYRTTRNGHTLRDGELPPEEVAMCKALSVALAFPVLVSVTGCAADGRSELSRREALRTVSVNKSVVVPDHPWVMGNDYKAATFFVGSLGLLMAATGTTFEAQQFEQFLSRSGIDVGDIVRHEFATRLVEARVFPSVVPEQGEGRIALTIERYGLFSMGGSPLPLSETMLWPVVIITATLSNKDGEVLWTNTASSASADGDVGELKLSEYLADPQRTRDALARAARVAAKVVLLDLGGAPEQIETPVIVAPPMAASRQSGGGAVPSDQGPLPAAGTTWTYRFVDHIYSRRRAIVTIQVLRSAGTVVQEAISSDVPGDDGSMRIVNVRQPRILEYRIGSSASLIEVAPYLLATEDDKPPSMSRVSGYPTGGTGSWNIKVLKGDWQEIATPAGTFRDLLPIAFQDLYGASKSLAGNPFAERFTIEAWYAPDVKRIVRIRHRAWGRDAARVISNESLELIAYRPPS